MEVKFLRPVRFPVFTVAFRNEVRHAIFVASSIPHPSPGEFRAGESARVRFSFSNVLAASHYTLTPAVGDWDEGYVPLDQREDVASLIVDSPLNTGGVADLPTELVVERP